MPSIKQRNREAVFKAIDDLLNTVDYGEVRIKLDRTSDKAELVTIVTEKKIRLDKIGDVAIMPPKS
jgi:hypothetical protein